MKQSQQKTELRPLAKGIRVFLMVGSVLSSIALAISLYVDLRSEAFGFRPLVAAVTTATFLLGLFLHSLALTYNSRQKGPPPLLSFLEIILEDCVVTISSVTKLEKYNFGMYVLRLGDYLTSLEAIAYYNVDQLDKIISFNLTGGAFSKNIVFLNVRTSVEKNKALRKLAVDCVQFDRHLLNVKELRTIPIISKNSQSNLYENYIVGYLIFLNYSMSDFNELEESEIKNCFHRSANIVSHLFYLFDVIKTK